MGYTVLPKSESPHVEDDDTKLRDSTFDRYHRRSQSLLIIIAWLSSLVLTFAVSGWYYSSTLSCAYGLTKDKAAVDYSSPLYGHLRPRLEAVTPKRDLWDDGNNIFRQDPNPKGDAAWTSLVKWNPILISKSEMDQLGMPTKGAVKWPNNPERPYVVRMDIFHLLHCVNELRKAVWFDHYQRNETLNPVYWDHKKHCADIIREEIMCTGSMNLYRMIWIDRQHKPWPEFTVNRQCRRWDDIQDWYEKHKLSDEDYKTLSQMVRPEDEYEYTMPSEGVKLVDALDAWEKKWNVSDEH
ncbi:hypothetical protein C1H76_8652 [Elsinoe australis]|uniref:Uncharacterized protein n=1 Tax=Elsinoe australis TaxID=40998 RepID=A0A4U7AMA9_9PEZI|nr:hypothetical protein C1H76_8652 [Elsinoe australis]